MMRFNSIRIVKAVSGDLKSMCDLLEQLFCIETDISFDEQKQRQGLLRLLNHNQAMIMLAKNDDQVIGMVTMQILISTVTGSEVGLIEDMIIHEDYRNQGMGSQLLAAMENKASQLGLTRLQLLADKHNRKAIDFYNKNNWQSTKMICLRKGNIAG